MTMDTPTSNHPNRKCWQIMLLAPIALPGALLALILVGIAAGISLPFTAILACAQRIGERRFRSLMQKNQRFIDWQSLENNLSVGYGTLIIEQMNKRPVHIWWTPDDVLAGAPTPPPEGEKLDILGVYPPHPFVSWCSKRYCQTGSGTGFLTIPTFALPPGLFFASFIKERYPRMTVIDTVYCA